tara:strand:+ start:154 stop:1203 length:1050 start_codon:yes stop_codon:yes gene_type:complete
MYTTITDNRLLGSHISLKGSEPEKINESIKLTFDYVISEKSIKSSIYKGESELENKDLKFTDLTNSIANSEERCILLNQFEPTDNHNDSQLINLFTIIFNKSHPNFSLYIENIKPFIKKTLKIISESFREISLELDDYDIIYKNDDFHFVKLFKLKSDLSSGFINQIKDIYNNNMLSPIMKTKMHVNKDSFANVFYYFYDSNSEKEPIFSISENDYVFSKGGKILDTNYNPKSKNFTEFKYNVYLPIVSFKDISENNKELAPFVNKSNINPSTINQIIQLFKNYLYNMINYKNILEKLGAKEIKKSKSDELKDRSSKIEYVDFKIEGGKIANILQSEQDEFFKAIAFIP